MTDRWTPEQAAAIVRTTDTLLSANAGTGKTATVVGKILWHLGLDPGPDEDGRPLPPCPPGHRIAPGQLAAITFTEKAAFDLARRLRAEVRARAPDLLWDLEAATVGTIHAFCGRLLREHALRFGLSPSFAVLDEREARVELAAIAREVLLAAAEAGDPDATLLLDRYPLDPPGGHSDAGAVNFLVTMTSDLRWHADRYAGWARGDRLDAGRLRELAGVWGGTDDATAALCDALFRLAGEVRRRWEADLARADLRDFDALVLDCRARLLDPAAGAALAAIRRRMRLLVIDEFQDTDDAQRDIAFRIAGRGDGGGGPLLFLVGDPKQSIYGFRGADISVWNEVERELGGALPLTRNYRSDPAVVDFVNGACATVLEEAGAEVAREGPGGRVAWTPLVAARSPLPSAGLEWLAADGDSAGERRAREAELVATRIRDLVLDPERGDRAGIEVLDPATGRPAPCAYRNVAILFRSGTGVPPYTEALARWGVPFHLAGNLGLREQLEVEDLLTLFRLVANPLDDLAAFTVLRGPFTGLRDETLARIRLTARGHSLLAQARRHLASGEWFEAPEHPAVAELERQSLGRTLDLVQRLVALRSRVPLDQLGHLALEASGYPLHLMLLEQGLPRLANLHRFVRLLEAYRSHTVGSFLELWDGWRSEDVGLPQAPLFSRRDNVVTLSTVHAAKGLEWPVVFLVDLQGFRDTCTDKLWSDRVLGPVLAPKQADRGDRTRRLCQRRQAEELAEEARVFYVAATRARDRLIVAGPASPAKGRAEWAARGRSPAMPVTAVIDGIEPLPAPPPPELGWLEGVVPAGELPDLAAPLAAPAPSHLRSATELMARCRNWEDHRLRYVHGITPVWRFERRPAVQAAGPAADLRGALVHGVLERIQEEEELAELLEVAVAALDAPELEEHLAPGSAYRVALEEEIRRVVTGREWSWYVDGPHWRELRFVHLRAPGRWRVGAMDLYRPGVPAVIVDFKTQQVTAGEVAGEARKYQVQAAVYRAAAAALQGPAQVRFHFTRPNVAVKG